MAGVILNIRSAWRILLAATLLACAALPSSSLAYDTDAALEQDGQLCTHQILRSERKYGIPQRLLASIAATESGRWHKGLGTLVPWPWTINVEGAGYYFHSKQAAIDAVRRHRAMGKKSIDVGCMQVNLVHHPDAFATLEQAFEPSYNVDYAATFLRGNYAETNSWKMAVGYYHSRTPSNSYPYIDRVYSQWYGFSVNPRAASSTNRTARTAAQRSAGKKYTSFIRVDNGDGQRASGSDSVREVTFSPDGKRKTKTSAKAASTNRKAVSVADVSSRSVKVVNGAESQGNKDLAVIRPAAEVAPEIAAIEKEPVAAGGVEGSAIINTGQVIDTGPMILNTQNMPLRSGGTRVVSLDDHNSSLPEDDKRFIRFTQ